MEISCSKCAQRYQVPDYKINDRRVFFYCGQCNEKIVIESRDDPWEPYHPFDRDSLTFKDIVSGIFFAFNKKNLFLSFLIVTIVFFITIISSYVYSSNAALATDYQMAFFLSMLVLSSVLLFPFDLHLYLISKNIFHRINNHHNMVFVDHRSEIRHDAKTVFCLSTGFLLILALFVLPVFPLNRYGLLYAGILYPFMYVFAFMFSSLMLFKPLLIAFIAWKSKGMRYTLHSMYRFIAVENINLLYYLVAILSLTAVVCTVLCMLSGASFAALTYLISGFLGPDLVGDGVSQNLLQLRPLMFWLDDTNSLPIAQSLGLFFIWLTLIFVVLLISAFFISTIQTLAAVAVFIMGKRPGTSVSRKLIVITAMVFFCSMFLLLLFFLKP